MILSPSVNFYALESLGALGSTCPESDSLDRTENGSTRVGQSWLGLLVQQLPPINTVLVK
jgi:hypothetical protein